MKAPNAQIHAPPKVVAQNEMLGNSIDLFQMAFHCFQALLDHARDPRRSFVGQQIGYPDYAACVAAGVRYLG